MVRKIRSVGRDRAVRPVRCVCGKTLDGATSVNADAAPSPGDLTVCIYCRSVLAFGPAGELQPVDVARLDPETRGVVEELRRRIAEVSSS